MSTARIEKDGWVRCGKCGHKLCRTVGAWKKQMAMPALEIKCHSCKILNYIMIGGQNNDRTSEA